MNSRLFTIGIFPWLAIAATTLFFFPSWPRRVLALVGWRRSFTPPADSQTSPTRWLQAITLGFVILYAAIQILAPLRHFLTPGGIEWNYAGPSFQLADVRPGPGGAEFFLRDESDHRQDDSDRSGPVSQ